MTRTIGNTAADSLELGLGYATRLLEGVTANKFARFANTGRAPIQSNHPAFILGHLSLYAPQILDHLGVKDSGIQVPDNFGTVFSKDAKCEDDPDGIIYPSMEKVTKFFFDAYTASVEQLRLARDETLQHPNPHEGRMAELFPTVGSLVTFYSGGHLMMHLGQMSAWRRMMGLGAA